MTYEEQFTEGFVQYAPLNYNLEKDLRSEIPWCRPWEGNHDLCEYFDPKKSPFEMGKLFASGYFDYIEMTFNE